MCLPAAMIKPAERRRSRRQKVLPRPSELADPSVDFRCVGVAPTVEMTPFIPMAGGFRYSRTAMKKVLITGIAGGQGRLVARKLLARRGRYRVHGVDRVPWKGRPARVALSIADVRKKKFEDVIRRERPDAIVHLAAIRHFSAHPAVRHEVNVNGTKRLIEFAVSHGVKNIVVCSSSYVYGAYPRIRTTSTRAPAQREPNLSGGSRPVRNGHAGERLSVGVSGDGDRRPASGQRAGLPRAQRDRPLSTHDYVPTLLGFDPMMQFIHEDDLAEVIVLALERNTRGVFNVVGPAAVPLHVAIREIGGHALPLPEVLLKGAIAGSFAGGISPFPPGPWTSSSTSAPWTAPPARGDGIRAALLAGGDLRRGIEV